MLSETLMPEGGYKNVLRGVGMVLSESWLSMNLLLWLSTAAPTRLLALLVLTGRDDSLFLSELLDGNFAAVVDDDILLTVFMVVDTRCGVWW